MLDITVVALFLVIQENAIKIGDRDSKAGEGQMGKRGRHMVDGMCIAGGHG